MGRGERAVVAGWVERLLDQERQTRVWLNMEISFLDRGWSLVDPFQPKRAINNRRPWRASRVRRPASSCSRAYDVPARAHGREGDLDHVTQLPATSLSAPLRLSLALIDCLCRVDERDIPSSPRSFWRQRELDVPRPEVPS